MTGLRHFRLKTNLSYIDKEWIKMKKIQRAPEPLAEAFKGISTCNIADALDKLGLPL
jgi:hypothetical protein